MHVWGFTSSHLNLRCVVNSRNRAESVDKSKGTRDPEASTITLTGEVGDAAELTPVSFILCGSGQEAALVYPEKKGSDCSPQCWPRVNRRWGMGLPSVPAQGARTATSSSAGQGAGDLREAR